MEPSPSSPPPIGGLTLGAVTALSGDVTTLDKIRPSAPSYIESMLGYGAGRLAEGYWIALLKEPLSPDDFKFGGTTLRSGGRYGLPGQTEEADAGRPGVHDGMMAEYGAAGYRRLQTSVLATTLIVGPRRIAKIVPVKRHVGGMAPSEQYPAGGGALQWKLVRDKRFLIAMHVSKDGTAFLPGLGTFSLSLNQSPQLLYDIRNRIHRYLISA